MENKEQKTFYIFIGVQGSGKSTIYKFINRKIDLGFRISQDIIIKQNMLDASSSSDIIKSVKILSAQLNDCIIGNNSFNLETAYASNALINHIKEAKENGFKIKVIYTCLDSYETALGRVNQRICKGGHFVDAKLIFNSFQKRFYNLRELLNVSDEVIFFDNTYTLQKIAYYKDTKFTYVNNSSQIMQDVYTALSDGQNTL